MSLFDYRASLQLVADDPPFYALIMAAMQRADLDNSLLLKRAFPEVWNESAERDRAPGGLLAGEEPA